MKPKTEKTTKTAAQQQAEKNLAFLQSIAKKTVTWHQTTLRPNISGGSITANVSDFTKYRMDVENLKKILAIVRTDLYLLMPKTDYLGFIEGYDVLDTKAELILRFGVVNLPKHSYYTSKRIFSSVVRSKQNLEIYDELKKEKKFLLPLYEEFEDYDY
jgi:hypothetical protein